MVLRLRQKTLLEFIISPLIKTLDNGRVVLPLIAMEFSGGRINGTTVNELKKWELYLTQYGYPIDVWKTLSEWRRDYPISEQ